MHIDQCKYIDYCRTPKNKKLLNVEEGAQKIVKFLNATSETEPIILINTKGTESLPALLDLLCRGERLESTERLSGRFCQFE